MLPDRLRRRGHEGIPRLRANAVLRGGQAARRRQIAATGGAAVSVDALPQECGLSPSAFHRAFKRVTAMTPVQYQRRMRLQEAKRLMVGKGLDAAGAGARVGYDDPSYFSREYRRFFGDPPRRHVERLREDAGMDGWAASSV